MILAGSESADQGSRTIYNRLSVLRLRQCDPEFKWKVDIAKFLVQELTSIQDIVSWRFSTSF